MGGGGAMRAAAKVAGIGAVNGGLRGFQAASSSEHSFTAAARKATRPVVSSTGDATSQNGVIEDSVQKPCWGIDDWEFACGEEEMFMESSESMPRLVFGGVPTLQEAQVATSELKDALEKTYLSPKSTGRTGSLISDQELETKACITSSDNTVTPLVPKHAIQAFMFLNQSPAVQSVVASIASDAKVWSAVMQNPELVGFLESYNMSGTFLEKEESVVDNGFQGDQTLKGFDKSSQPEESGNWFTNSLKNTRMAVVDMMSSLSDYFENLFGGGKVSEEANGCDIVTAVDMAMGTSFVGLAVMVMMIVVLKRG